MMDARSFVPHLIRWEGSVDHLYRDSSEHGWCTVGIGCLVPSRDAAADLPFLDDAGMFAHKEAVKADFDRVMAMAPGRPARFYLGMPALTLSDESITDLAIKRIETEFLPGLRAEMAGYDNYHEAAQIALLDMAWNLGLHGLHGFPSLLGSCRHGDWMAAANESHRKTTRADRNDWTRSQFLLAAT